LFFIVIYILTLPTIHLVFVMYKLLLEI